MKENIVKDLKIKRNILRIIYLADETTEEYLFADLFLKDKALYKNALEQLVEEEYVIKEKREKKYYYRISYEKAKKVETIIRERVIPEPERKFKLFWIGIGKAGCNILEASLKRLSDMEEKDALINLTGQALGNQYLALIHGPELNQMLNSTYFRKEDILPLYDKTHQPETGCGGKAGKGKELFGINEDKVKSAIEEKIEGDHIDVFVVTNSIAGGTGAGFTPMLLTFLRENYANSYIYNFQIFPFKSETWASINVIYSLGENLKILFEGENSEKNYEKTKMFVLSDQYFYDGLLRDDQITSDERKIYPFVNPLVVDSIYNILYQALISTYKTRLDSDYEWLNTLSITDIANFVHPFGVLCFIEGIKADELVNKKSFNKVVKDALQKFEIIREEPHLLEGDKVRNKFRGSTARLDKYLAKSVLAILSGSDRERVGQKQAQQLHRACLDVLGPIPTYIRINFYWTAKGDIKIILCIGGANFRDIWYWLERFDKDYPRLVKLSEIVRQTGLTPKELQVARSKIYEHREKILPPSCWENDVLKPPHISGNGTQA